MLATLDPVLATVASPPLVPDDKALDLPHLFRMTLGDQRLQCEVLTLFERQAGMLMGRMRADDPAAAAALAHTLKGSARGIGAWQVAEAAEAVEAACAEGREFSNEQACLADRVAQACSAVVAYLRLV